MQKKILLSTVMETYQKFKAGYPEVKVGISKFASLCPLHVLPVSEWGPIQVEHYFAVDYIDRFYIVRTIAMTKPGFWSMKFLHQASLAGETLFK